MPTETQGQWNVARLVLGLAIVAAGVIFTLDNLGILDADDALEFWPVVLVILGVAHLVQTQSWGGYIWSLLLIVAGLWVLAENLLFIHISIWKLSPLLLVLLGGSIAWRAFAAPRLPSGIPASPDRFIKATAVMGGIERSSDSTEFQGADLVAFMGGCEIDLRRTVIAGDAAVIEVLIVMGGIELKIPEDWVVDVRALPVMGGVSVAPRVPRSENPQRLVLRGTVVMGGVEIKR
jgi:predicted membrane protein